MTRFIGVELCPHLCSPSYKVRVVYPLNIFYSEELSHFPVKLGMESIEIDRPLSVKCKQKKKIHLLSF